MWGAPRHRHRARARQSRGRAAGEPRPAAAHTHSRTPLGRRRQGRVSVLRGVSGPLTRAPATHSRTHCGRPASGTPALLHARQFPAPAHSPSPSLPRSQTLSAVADPRINTQLSSKERRPSCFFGDMHEAACMNARPLHGRPARVGPANLAPGSPLATALGHQAASTTRANFSLALSLALCLFLPVSLSRTFAASY